MELSKKQLEKLCTEMYNISIELDEDECGFYEGYFIDISDLRLTFNIDVKADFRPSFCDTPQINELEISECEFTNEDGKIDMKISKEQLELLGDELVDYIEIV